MAKKADWHIHRCLNTECQATFSHKKSVIMGFPGNYHNNNNLCHTCPNCGTFTGKRCEPDAKIDYVDFYAGLDGKPVERAESPIAPT